jgi:cytoskeletal protein RodZ
MPALGERFRAAREARGLTLSEVAEQIRIRSVYLAAIEEENWPSIGAPVYVRGFLRTYARFLGLDPEEAVGEFNASGHVVAAPEAPAYGEAPARRANRSLLPFIWVASIVAVLLIAYVAYNAFVPHDDQPANVAASPSPSAGATALAAVPASTTSPTPGAGASAVPATPNTLEVRLSAPSWLRVVVDGNVSIEGTFPAGTAKTFRGKNALLRVGNAAGVAVFVDGKPVGPLGKAGDVVERSFNL